MNFTGGIKINVDLSLLLLQFDFRLDNFDDVINDHFYGHYGTAWQNQIKEFPNFPGAILMTTNCIQRPKNDYKDNIFTRGMVGWPDVPHIADQNFKPLIDRALFLPGFEDDVDNGKVTVGFAHNAVLGVADKMIEAIKNDNLVKSQNFRI